MRPHLSIMAAIAVATPLAAQDPRLTAAEPKVVILREGRTVAPEAVATIVVTPAGDTINPGDCRKFTAVALDASRRPVAVPNFSFAVSDATRLKVDPPSGEVCAGTGWSRDATAAYVTASFPNSAVSGTASLMVRPQPVPPRRQGPAVAAPAPQPTFTTKP